MKNRSLVHFLAFGNSKDIGEILLSKGANINLKDIDLIMKIFIIIIKLI